MEHPLIGFLPQPARDEYRRRTAEQFGAGRLPAPVYRMMKRALLGAEVMRRKRVYLDTKYWVWLRDAAEGHPQQPRHVELLDSLRVLVTAGRVLCPIADAAFVELLMIGDPIKRMATARIMDELSQGVALVVQDERVYLELAAFRRSTRGSAPLVPIQQDVWTRASFVLAEMVPETNGVTAEQQHAIQRAMDDMLWSHGLAELLEMIDRGIAPFLPDMRALKEKLTVDLHAGKRRHAHEIPTFQSAYEHELRGALDEHADAFARVMAASVSAEVVAGLTAEDKSGRPLSHEVFDVLRRQPVASAIPSLSINAAIHAAFRWDRERKVKKNDWVDVMHAVAALPYCDLFLTEGSLAALVQSGHMALADLYGTAVAADVADAMTALACL